MLEKLSKLQNEEMPALVDTIRDQIGAEQAEAFKQSMTPALMNLYQVIAQSRESSDSAVRQLAGEESPAGDMALGGPEAGLGEPGADLGGTGLDGESDMDSDLGAPPEGDGFDATDAAAGGDEELGRERR
jgi:hypothetical protein